MGLPPYAAVVLAGGQATRLGGVRKPMLLVGGVPLLERVLTAVADAAPRIVVGPRVPLPPGVRRTREQPPGGGPVAATAAGLAMAAADPRTPEEVALLGADLPFLTVDAVSALRAAASRPANDGAVFVDDTGRRQLLCGVWRLGALRESITAHGDPSGIALRVLFDGMRVAELHAKTTPPPWYDCDTPEDVRKAEGWASERA